MKGLSKASLEDSTQRARALNITLPPNPTRGWLIQALKDTTDTRHLRQVQGLDVQRSASACSTWIGAWPRWTDKPKSNPRTRSLATDPEGQGHVRWSVGERCLLVGSVKNDNGSAWKVRACSTKVPTVHAQGAKGD